MKFYHEIKNGDQTFFLAQILGFLILGQILGLYGPLQGPNIVLGRRNNHYSICREILHEDGVLPFLRAKILNFRFWLHFNLGLDDPFHGFKNRLRASRPSRFNSP